MNRTATGSACAAGLAPRSKASPAIAKAPTLGDARRSGWRWGCRPTRDPDPVVGHRPAITIELVAALGIGHHPIGRSCHHDGGRNLLLRRLLLRIEATPERERHHRAGNYRDEPIADSRFAHHAPPLL